MARSRNIKPGFFTNDVLGELPALTRLLFAGIWTICDREGRLEDRPKKIRAEVLPYDDCDADAMLQELHDAGFIQRYTSAGKQVIQVLAWAEHQNPHMKEAASTLPAPEQHQTSTVLVQCEAQPLPERAGLIPDSLSLIPDSPIRGDGAGEKEVLNAGSVCKAIRAKGVMDVNPSHPELRALIAQGVSVEAFEAAAEKCAKGNPPKGMAYLLAIVKRQLSEAASIAAGPAAVSAVVDPDSRSAIEAEGEAKGFGRWNEAGEQWHIYKARVRGNGQSGPSLEMLARMAELRKPKLGAH